VKLSGLFTEEELQTGLLCRAFSRHFLTEGATYAESHGTRWVDRLTCEFCGTKRITPKIPHTLEFIRNADNPHDYKHGPFYDSSVPAREALAIVMDRLAAKTLPKEVQVRSIQGQSKRRRRGA
jgi:hypothetical protein